MTDGEHGGRLRVDGGENTAFCGYVNRDSRLKAAFPEMVYAGPEFNALSLNCRADAFPSLYMVGHAIHLLRNLSGQKNHERKIRIKTLVGKHPRSIEKGLCEPLVLFVSSECGLGEGVALVWLPIANAEHQPSGVHTERGRYPFDKGEVWLGYAALIVSDR